MLIEQFQNKTVEIEGFQTSFIVLKVENTVLRFYFKNKKESFIKHKQIGILTFHKQHPLLINHNESYCEMYINSKPENPDLFVKDLKNSIDEATEEWRHWKDYIKINTGISELVFFQNIQKGSGKLLYAPFSIIEEIEKVCERHHIAFRSFGEKIRVHNQLLMIHDQFVIAEDFVLRTY